MKLYFYTRGNRQIAIDTKNRVFTTSLVKSSGDFSSSPQYILVPEEGYINILEEVLADGYEPNWYAS